MKRLLVFSLACFSFCRIFAADPVITMFMVPYPMDNAAAQKAAAKLRKPGKIAQRKLEGSFQVNSVAGIYSTYAGFIEVSNAIGQTTFPRKHTKPYIYMLVTPRITPIIMFEQTVNHWELDKQTPAAMYSYERTYDKETDLMFWEAKKEALPENNQVPLESIVIFAKPEYVHIPLGITLTRESQNFILPDIFIKKGISYAKNAMFLLYLIHLFGPIHPNEVKSPTRYSSQVVY